MPVIPEVTREILDAYLRGTLPLADAADRIASTLTPTERHTFTIEVPIGDSGSREATLLAALRQAVVNLAGLV